MISFDKNHTNLPFAMALLQKEDAALLHELIHTNARRLYKYFPITVKENSSLIASENYIYKKIREASRKENYTFKIVDNTSKLLIGLLIIKNIAYATKTCELAYFVDEHYEGKGIITAGIAQILHYCKTELQLQKAILVIGDDNPKSLRIAEKYNFTLVKRVVNGHEDFHGNRMDVLHFERSI